MSLNQNDACDAHAVIDNLNSNIDFENLLLQQAKAEHPQPLFYPEEIRIFANIILENSNCIELRAIGNKNSSNFDEKQTLIGFYDNIDFLIRDCKIHHNKKALYVGLNPRKYSLLQSREPNKLSTGEGAKASDIVHRRFIPIDIDTVRETKTAASDIEIRNAFKVFEAVKCDLARKNIKPVICGFSGNGLHIIIKTIPYSNDEVPNNLVGLLFRYFNRKYVTENAKVDSSTGDLGRIWKIYGTASIKGDNTIERPRRTARILDYNENIEVCDIFKLYEKELIEQNEFESQVTNYQYDSFRSASQSNTKKWNKYKGNLNSFDIIDFCKSKNIYHSYIRDNMHAIRCPFSNQHTVGDDGDRSTVVFEAENKKWPGFHCKHDHCSGKNLEHFLSNWPVEEIDRFCTEVYQKVHINTSSVPILPLIRHTEESIEYPSADLGELLGAATDVTHEVIQAPLAVCAQSFLACASFLAQQHVNLLIDGRISPASLYFLTIAESGDRKTAVDKVALDRIYRFERKLMEKYQKDLKEYEEQIQQFRRNRSKSNQGHIGDKKMPRPPICPLLLAQEPTYEGLFKQFANGQCALNLSSDEGGRMFGGYAMNQDNMLKTIAGLSELWDGSPISRVRSSEPIAKLYDRRLSMHLLLQPIVAEKIFSDPILLGQGFLARMLSWHPTSLSGRFYKRVNIYREPPVMDFFERVDEILKLRVPISLDSPGQLMPRNVTLSENAHLVFCKFHDEVEMQIGPQGNFSNIKPFASKAAELAARIALVIQFFHHPEIKEISEQWMKRGCRLVSAYLQEANRLWDKTPISEDIACAEKTRLWLIKHKILQISGKELYQKGPKIIRSVETASRIVQMLVRHGYLQPLANQSQHFASKTWRVINEDPTIF